METAKKTYNVFEIKDFFDSISRKSSSDKGIYPAPKVDSAGEEIQISFQTERTDESILLQCIQLLSASIENWRIYSIDKGYISLQAPSGVGKYGIESFRIRITLYPDKTQVLATKNRELEAGELHCIHSLHEFLCLKNSPPPEPGQILRSLGIGVFDPVEEELKTGLKSDFSMISGYEVVKRQIIETIIYPLKHPGVFEQMNQLTRRNPGRTRPRAVLFEGSPGVGKTSMARVVSSECRIPLIYVPIESILSKYYGESSQNLALVFDAASLYPACLLFLDEIDSLAGKREDGMFDANRKLLSVLLRKLDGFESKGGTITIGATNRKKDLDPALLSRFDRSIFFPLPTVDERTEILLAYAFHLELQDRQQISREMEGFSGRNIKDFCDLVERSWTTELLISRKDIRPPPPEFYLYSLKAYRLNHLDI